MTKNQLLSRRKFMQTLGVLGASALFPNIEAKAQSQASSANIQNDKFQTPEFHAFLDRYLFLPLLYRGEKPTWGKEKTQLIMPQKPVEPKIINQAFDRSSFPIQRITMEPSPKPQKPNKENFKTQNEFKSALAKYEFHVQANERNLKKQNEFRDLLRQVIKSIYKTKNISEKQGRVLERRLSKASIEILSNFEFHIPSDYVELKPLQEGEDSRVFQIQEQSLKPLAYEKSDLFLAKAYQSLFAPKYQEAINQFYHSKDQDPRKCSYSYLLNTYASFIGHKAIVQNTDLCKNEHGEMFLSFSQNVFSNRKIWNELMQPTIQEVSKILHGEEFKKLRFNIKDDGQVEFFELFEGKFKKIPSLKKHPHYQKLLKGVSSPSASLLNQAFKKNNLSR